MKKKLLIVLLVCVISAAVFISIKSYAWAQTSPPGVQSTIAGLIIRLTSIAAGQNSSLLFIGGPNGPTTKNTVGQIKASITDTNPCATVFRRQSPCQYTESDSMRSIVDIYGTGVFGKTQAGTTNAWGSWANTRNPGIKILPEGSVVMGGMSSLQANPNAPATQAVPVEMPAGFENLTQSDRYSGIYDFLLSMPTPDDYKGRSGLFVRNLVVGDVADPVDLVIRRASSSTDPALANSSSYGKFFPLTPLPQAIGVLKWEGMTRLGWRRTSAIVGDLVDVTSDNKTPGTLAFLTAGRTDQDADITWRMVIDSYGKIIMGKNIRNIAPTAQLDVRGDIKAQGCSGCADVAEDYQSNENLESGDVVMLDSSKSGFIVRSKGSYNKKIIGVVSSAPAVRISEDGGITMSNGDSKKSSNGYPVALSGRVPVKVSTENGPIEIGDYLTSSSTPGVAMKATETGPVIGKAIEGFSSSTVGQIKVFVSNTYYVHH